MTTSNNVITTDHALTGEQRNLLRTLAGSMIPANAEYAVPGADDPSILADIVRTAASSAELVGTALAALNDAALAAHARPFSVLDAVSQRRIAEALQRTHALLLRALISIVVQCYYRDDRVMASLGLEARAPFPDGYVVDDGDWSLLDPVRRRAKMYRE